MASKNGNTVFEQSVEFWEQARLADMKYALGKL